MPAPLLRLSDDSDRIIAMTSESSQVMVNAIYGSILRHTALIALMLFEVVIVIIMGAVLLNAGRNTGFPPPTPDNVYKYLSPFFMGMLALYAYFLVAPYSPTLSPPSLGLGYRAGNRRISRYAMRRCTHCGYDLRAVSCSDACPECAASVNSVSRSDVELIKRLRLYPGWTVYARVGFVLLLLCSIWTLQGYPTISSIFNEPRFVGYIAIISAVIVYECFRPLLIRWAVPPVRHSNLIPERLFLERGICPACLTGFWHLSADPETGLVGCPECGAQWTQRHEVIPVENADISSANQADA